MAYVRLYIMTLNLSTIIKVCFVFWMVCVQEGAEQPFVFVVQLMFPGPPHLTLVIYFAPHAFSPIRGDGTPFSEVMSGFLDGTDQDRTDRFKVIPRVVEVRVRILACSAT